MRVGYLIDTQVSPLGDPRAAMEAMVEEGLLAERSGFHSVQVPDRHQAGACAFPGCEQLLTLLAYETSRVQLGSFTFVGTLTHPMKALEQFAVVDRLSGGRLATTVSEIQALLYDLHAMLLSSGPGSRDVFLWRAEGEPFVGLLDVSSNNQLEQVVSPELREATVEAEGEQVLQSVAVPTMPTEPDSPVVPGVVVALEKENCGALPSCWPSSCWELRLPALLKVRLRLS